VREYRRGAEHRRDTGDRRDTEHRRDEPGLATPTRAYLGLLAITLLNPATVVYFAALVLGRRAGETSGAHAAGAFVVAAAVASASWQLLLAGGGMLIGRVLTGPRGRLCSALLSGVLIVGLAGYVVIPR
jgi:arginine exporter protein ArgO